MNNRDNYFKGQQDNEIFVCFFRHHWLTLARDFFYSGIILVIATLGILNISKIIEILRGNYELKLLFMTIFLLGTIYIHRLFVKLLNYFLNIGIITNIRIIDHERTLFFRDTMDSIDMAQIQNIEQIKEGIIPYLFKLGEIKVFMTASAATKTFHYVPNAKFHFRCMNRAKEVRQNSMRQTHRGLNEEQTLDKIYEPSIISSEKSPTTL